MAEDHLLANMTVAPTHPGKVFAEIVLPALGVQASVVARRLDLSEPDFNALLIGEYTVDSTMADRIGELSGNGPTLWLKMQQFFDAWNALHRPRFEPGSSSFSAGE